MSLGYFLPDSWWENEDEKNQMGNMDNFQSD